MSEINRLKQRHEIERKRKVARRLRKLIRTKKEYDAPIVTTIDFKRKCLISIDQALKPEWVHRLIMKELLKLGGRQ